MTALLKEMKAFMPDKYMSMASQAAEDNRDNEGVSADQLKYIDHCNIMNHDYTVPHIPDKQPMSPNQNLYNAPLPVVQWSINYTMHDHLAAGVTSAAV